MKSVFICIFILLFSPEVFAQESTCLPSLPKIEGNPKSFGPRGVRQICYNGSPTVMSCSNYPAYLKNNTNFEIRKKALEFEAEKNAIEYIEGGTFTSNEISNSTKAFKDDDYITGNPVRSTMLQFRSSLSLKPDFVYVINGDDFRVCAIYSITQSNNYGKCIWNNTNSDFALKNTEMSYESDEFITRVCRSKFGQYQSWALEEKISLSQTSGSYSSTIITITDLNWNGRFDKNEARAFQTKGKRFTSIVLPAKTLEKLNLRLKEIEP